MSSPRAHRSTNVTNELAVLLKTFVCFVPFRGYSNISLNVVFVDDGDAERLCFVELRSGRLACHNVICLLAYRRINSAAARFDQRPRLIAREARQRSGQHKLFPGEALISFRATATFGFSFYSCSPQPIT